VSIELSDLSEIDWARGSTLLVSEKVLQRTLPARRKV